jgi:hypothetical protein
VARLRKAMPQFFGSWPQRKSSKPTCGSNITNSQASKTAEVPGGSGCPLYTLAVQQLDGDMDQYIHDNTEDELTHEVFINAYLASKGADMVNLDKFRTLPSSKATGAQQIGRLTNLMQLTVDTSWWTRYRSRKKNPDFGDTFRQAIPTLAHGEHPAIPRTDEDVKPDPTKPNNISDFTQAIANTAGFHFAFIEQGGTSLYPMLAQRVSNVEVLRIVLSIGGVEIAHFQTWHDKAGQCASVDRRGRSCNGCKGDLSGPQLFSFGRRGLSNQPDHARADGVPQQEVAGLLDHSPHADSGGGDGGP